MRELPEPRVVCAELSADVLAALDRFIAEQHDGLSRSEAVALLVRDVLIGSGYLGVGKEKR